MPQIMTQFNFHVFPLQWIQRDSYQKLETIGETLLKIIELNQEALSSFWRVIADKKLDSVCRKVVIEKWLHTSMVQSVSYTRKHSGWKIPKKSHLCERSELRLFHSLRKMRSKMWYWNSLASLANLKGIFLKCHFQTLCRKVQLLLTLIFFSSFMKSI